VVKKSKAADLESTVKKVAEPIVVKKEEPVVKQLPPGLAKSV